MAVPSNTAWTDSAGEGGLGRQSRLAGTLVVPPCPMQAAAGCSGASSSRSMCATEADPFLGTSRNSSPNMAPLAPTAEQVQALAADALPCCPMAQPQQQPEQACSSRSLHGLQPAVAPPAGACSSSESALCAKLAAIMGSSVAPPAPQHHHQQQQQLLGPRPAAAAATAPSAAGQRPSSAAVAAAPTCHPKEWLYQLVTCSFLFKPCPDCAASHTGREVLVTYFDTDNPAHGYCTYCPSRAAHPHLLQIRRSTYHEVIKAGDIARMVDTTGIQHYVINGAKVLFLRPRPQPRPPKGVVAPARCMVDGRQLMDHSSCYCSLRCKLESEDAEFSRRFPHEVLEAADAAADAAATAAASSHDQVPRARAVGGVAVVTGKRSAAAAAAAAEAARAASPSRGTSSGDDAAGTDQEHGRTGGWPRRGSRSKRQRTAPVKYADGSASGLQQQQQQQAGSALTGPAAAGAGEEVERELQRCYNKGAASPCNSADSERSSTCNYRWQHKRKGEPVRSPLQ